jgi:hypothetical protein
MPTSDREGPFHLGSLQLALSPLPVPVDVGGHLQRRVTKVAGEPRDLGAVLEGSFCKRMPEAMERAKLLSRPDPRDLRTLQRWVELATKKECRRQKVVAAIFVEDEIVRVTA